jgi:hypothetical protein
MPGQPWLEALRGDLARRGLPPGYVKRFLRELEDHVEDISQEQEEIMRTDAQGTTMESNAALSVEERLGGREQLAEQAVAEFQRANFAGRHPVWTFLVAPIPAALIAWVLFYVVFVFGIEGLAWVAGGGVERLHQPAEE